MISCELLAVESLATVKTVVVITAKQRFVVEGWDAVIATANRPSAGHHAVKGGNGALSAYPISAAVNFDERVTESPSHHVTAIQAGRFLPVQPLYRCAGYVEPEHVYSR